MTYSKGFKWGAQQYARTNLGLNLEIVRNQQIVDDSEQNLIDFASRSDQADLLQPLDCIFFRLTLPKSLALDRRRILRPCGLVAHRLWGINHDFGEFVIAVEFLQIVAPHPGLCLQVELVVEAEAQVRLFTVDVRRQPKSGS